MRTIYNVYVCDEEGVEVEGMFDDCGNLIGTWSLNDGHWKQECFCEFMKKLGISIEKSQDALLKEKLIKHWDF
jgi:hypothetical protein